MWLINLLNRLIDWFQPSHQLIEKHPGQHYNTTRFCRLNVIASIAASCIIFFMFIIRALLEGIVSNTLYALLFASVFFASLPFIIKTTARYEITSSIILIAALIILPFRVMDTGGLTSAVLTWYVGACLVFFVIGSLKLGLIAFILSFIEITALYYVTKNQWGNTEFVASLEVHYWVSVLAMTLSIVVISWYEKQRLDNIKTLQKQNKKISDDNTLLNQQKHELEKANLDKSTLISVLSHDIANPLNVITNFVDMMLDEQPDNEKLKNILWATNVIAQIIDHSRQLQVSDIKSSNMTLEPVSLADCFKQSDFIFSNLLKEKQLKIAVDAEQLKDIKVLAEPVSLCNFVINNIISNAIKFSEPDNIINVTAFIENNKVHLNISDNGIGMPDTILKNLFDPSKLSSEKGTQGESGTGLGMKIMSSYVKSYGGKVNVTSKQSLDDPEHHGTTFQIILQRS